MADGSIITQELKSLIGIPSEPTVYKIEEGAITRFAEAIGDPNPLFNDIEYAKGSKYGRLMCPMGFTGWPCKGNIEIVNIFEKLIKAGAPPRILDGGMEYDFYIPVGAGDVLISTSKIAHFDEKETKGGKMLISTIETTFWNQNGDVVLKSRNSVINR